MTSSSTANLKAASATNAPPQFVEALFQGINGYFKDNNLSKKGDWTMGLKVALALIWWAGTFVTLYAFELTYWQFLLIYVLHLGTAQTNILFNIPHDANHRAISQKPLVNKLLSYTFDLCGMSSYIWRFLHHRAHHYCVNVEGEDETLIARGIFRFSPHSRRRKMHRYQHLYVFFAYGFFMIDWVLFKDWQYFFFSDFYRVKGVKHPIKEYVALFVGKAFYYTYMLVLPIVVLEFSLWQVLSAFFLVEFFIGISTTSVLQVVHPVGEADCPKNNNDYENFVYHIFATTADYSARNPLANWFWGGLNLHVVHHLNPYICHIHFPKLTEIVKATAKEYGVEYRENKSIFQALAQHYSFMKRLATLD